MSSAPKKDYSIEELEAKYHDITTLYDHAEELVATVESEFVKDPEAQLEIIEPLITEMGDAADVLAEEFVLIAESQKQKTQSKASKKRIEGALRKIFSALSDYQTRVRGNAKKAQGAIKNIADPIVNKIHRQLDKIVGIFLEFVQISLANLMSKAEVEALKARDTRIAMLMHQMAMAQQQ